MTATTAQVPPPLDSAINLADLRRQLTRRMAVLLALAGGILSWTLLPGSGFPAVAWAFVTLLAALGLLCLVVEPHAPLLVRFLLVGGAATILTAALVLTPAPWLPFLAPILLVLGAMLITGSELVLGVGLLGVTYWLTATHTAGYVLGPLAATVLLAIVMAWLIRHSLYTALQWAWNSEQRAAHLLAEVRTHRGQLSQALKSYELANARLRRTERELIIARQQSDEARRIKEQFAANVSHELRTPLNLVLGFSEIMYRTPEVYGPLTWPPKLRRDVYQIHRSSQHLLTMIDDILALSRFEMARFELHTEPTALADLVEGTVEIVRDLFRSNATQLIVELAPSLPTVVVDQTRIRQVLLNLLSNALRFTEGGVVWVKAWCDGEAVTVCVADNGPGISADKLPHLFEEFYQVDLSLRRSHQGAGLGLAISKRFVEMHDGQIWVESEEGQGAAFYFTLPTPNRHIPLVRPHLEHPLDVDAAAAIGCVLVVDPDPQVAHLLASHIDRCTVKQLSHPGLLPAAVAQELPQAVIYNVRPDGAPAQALAADLPVPIIRCSLPSRAWIAGTRQVVACHSKPVTREQVIGAVMSVDGAKNVLIVDDDRGFCQLVARHLESATLPVTVTAAYSGEEGLEMALAQPPDLMLLDLVLPGLDGFDVLKAMAKEPSLNSIPVVLLTATSYVEEAFAQGDAEIVLTCATGLQPGEALRSIAAMVGALQPRVGTPLEDGVRANRGMGNAAMRRPLDDPQVAESGKHIASPYRLG